MTTMLKRQHKTRSSVLTVMGLRYVAMTNQLRSGSQVKEVRSELDQVGIHLNVALVSCIAPIYTA